MNDDAMDSMLEWRERWIAEMTQRSQHDPSSPLGQYVLDSTNHFQLLTGRHEEGLHWERVGNLIEALILYEANVADAFHNISPYERLRIIYTDRRWFEDALRVCEAYLTLPCSPAQEVTLFSGSCREAQRATPTATKNRLSLISVKLFSEIVNARPSERSQQILHMAAEAATCVALRAKRASMPPVSRAWEPTRLVMLLCKIQNENC